LLAVRVDLGLRQENRHELVSPFSDLTSYFFEGDVMTEVRERSLPGPGVRIDGIDQRPVNVEDNGFGHIANP
jgi:hypothetical protein